MSPSRAKQAQAIARAEGFPARLGSARDLFPSARTYFFQLENQKIAIFCLELKKLHTQKLFSTMFYEKREFLTSKIPVLRIHTIKTPLIVQIYITMFFLGPKNLTIKGYQKKIQLGFSSKIKVSQLGSTRNLHSSARAGKFQLGLITTS